MTNVDDPIKDGANKKDQKKMPFLFWRKYLPHKLIDSLDEIKYNSNIDKMTDFEDVSKNYYAHNENSEDITAQIKLNTQGTNKIKNVRNIQQNLDTNTEKEVDGFIWIKDADDRNTGSLKWRLRKYFVRNPEMEAEKYIEDNDIMIENGFVFVGANIVVQPRTAEKDFALGLIDFIAGSLGGFVQVIVSQPFDTIKVKQQMNPKLYTNMFKSMHLIGRKEGLFRGFYAGTQPAILASIAENSILFASYGRIESQITSIMDINNVQDLSVLGNATAGFFTAFFSTFTLCPAELVKCKLQAQSDAKNFIAKNGNLRTMNAWQVTKEIVEVDGISGLYRGLMSTFAREMPGLFFFFGGYEGTRTYFTKPGQSKDDIGALRTMLAGMIGGVSLWVTTYPIDVVKTRIQVENLQKSMLSVAWTIIGKEGFFTLYKGLLPSVLRTIPASATLFCVYEYSKKVMTLAAGLE